MAIVINKSFTGSKPIGNGTVQVLQSANTPDYSSDDWYINPSLDNVINHSIKYWKIINNQILLMSEEEQMLVNDFIDQSLIETTLNYIESDNVSSTTSTFPQNKLTLLVNDLQYNIKYKIWWYCEIGTYRKNESYMNITINDNIIAQSSKSVYVHNDNNMLIFEAVSGSHIIENTNGAIEIKLNYCDLEWGGSSVYIKNAKLGFIKI